MKERKRKKERECWEKYKQRKRQRGFVRERVKDIGEEKDRERRRELKKQYEVEKKGVRDIFFFI